MKEEDISRITAGGESREVAADAEWTGDQIQHGMWYRLSVRPLCTGVRDAVCQTRQAGRSGAPQSQPWSTHWQRDSTELLTATSHLFGALLVSPLPPSPAAAPLAGKTAEASAQGSSAPRLAAASAMLNWIFPWRC
jgi:hypothetical protein